MKETVYNIQASVNLIITLIADFHNIDPESTIRSLSAHYPDIIAIAGDFLVGYRPKGDGLIVESQENVLPFLSACVGVAPTYVSLGNHEWIISDEDIELLCLTGAVLLDNSCVVHEGIALGGSTSAIVWNYQTFRAGTGERYPYRPKHTGVVRTEIGWLDELERVEGFRVLMCHHSEYYPRYLQGKQIDLNLSGHAHGEQDHFFGRGLYAPGQGWLPEYTSGVYDGRLVVSHGLVNTDSPAPRIFNPIEIVYIRTSSSGKRNEEGESA